MDTVCSFSYIENSQIYLLIAAKKPMTVVYSEAQNNWLEIVHNFLQ